MDKNITRRDFIKQSAAVGAASIVGANMVAGCGQKEATTKVLKDVGVSIVTGEDYFQNALKAVEQIGGMGGFVPAGSKIAILANPQRNNPGAFTKPEILKAAIQMCKETNAEAVDCISWLPEQNWELTGLKAVVEEEGAGLFIADRRDEFLFQPVPVPKGTALTEARVMKKLFEYDILIDIPVTKDHAGNKFTGTMKNLMGLNSPLNNRTFHKENWKTDPEDIAHLDRCIADLNTVITPDLCIVDATEFIITNGPFGPGEIVKPKKVIAGTDRVAIDAVCCTLWGLKGEDIIHISEAYAHGLGEIDLGKVKIMETTA